MTSRHANADRAGTRLIVRPGVLTAIYEHLEAAYPEEAPGGLLGIVRDETAIEVAEAVAATNVRRDERRRRYLIAPHDVLAMERRGSAAGLQVVGYYHSHPDAAARPSEFDREHAWPWYTYLIVEVADGRAVEARAWRLKTDRTGFEELAIAEAERAAEDTVDKGDS